MCKQAQIVLGKKEDDVRDERQSLEVKQESNAPEVLVFGIRVHQYVTYQLLQQLTQTEYHTGFFNESSNAPLMQYFRIPEATTCFH